MARTHTGQLRGEFLDITAGFLKPYDILDEGRCVRGIEGAYGRWYEMIAGPCHAEVEIIELADGPRCLWRPVWGEVHREEIPRGTFRVFRGDLPGFFCEAEPDGPRDPCSSGRCPLLNDGTPAEEASGFGPDQPGSLASPTGEHSDGPEEGT